MRIGVSVRLTAGGEGVQARNDFEQAALAMK